MSDVKDPRDPRGAVFHQAERIAERIAEVCGQDRQPMPAQQAAALDGGGLIYAGLAMVAFSIVYVGDVLAAKAKPVPAPDEWPKCACGAPVRADNGCYRCIVASVPG